MEFQKAYRETERPTVNTGEGLTEQAHKRETDINYILRDYERTGFIKHAKQHQGTYDDISVQDFQEAMFIVKQAQNMFSELPGAVKKRFSNDPREFLSFVQNPANLEEMGRLGILKGNDGIDIKGTSVNVPTKAHYDEVKQQQHEAAVAANSAPAEPS